MNIENIQTGTQCILYLYQRIFKLLIYVYFFFYKFILIAALSMQKILHFNYGLIFLFQIYDSY